MSLLDNASLLLTPNAYKEGKLYSVIPSNGNGDFTATRATTATRVNAAGLVDLVPYNLLTYSEQFENAAWVKTRATITANTTLAPNATLTADSLIQSSGQTSRGFISTANISILGAVTYSIYAKKNTKDFVILTDNALGLGFENSWFNINTGTLGTIAVGRTASITSVGDGWYRCSITVNVTLLPSQYLFGLADTNNSTTVVDSGGIFLWGAQLVEGTSARDYLRTETRLNIPRVDYSLGGCPNILLEPQRTNLALQSSSFDNLTTWVNLIGGTGVNSTRVANAVISPSGIQDADTITLNRGAGNTISDFSCFFQSVTLAAVTYTFSFWVKANSAGEVGKSILLRIPTANITNQVVTLTNSWQRVTFTSTANATAGLATIDFFNRGTLTTGNQVTFDIWGAQLEAGAYATSYIPTTTASVTRNADSLTRNNIFTNGLITAAGGTWFVELRNNRVLTRDNGNVALYLGDSLTPTSGNGLYILNGGGADRLSIYKRVAGSGTFLFTTTANTSKIVIKWNGATADIFQNGVKVVTATAFATTLMENIYSASAGPCQAISINEMALFPTPLTDAQCLALTA